MHIAKICSTKRSRSGTTLKIDEKGIRFFIAALDDSFEFFEQESGSASNKLPTQWHLCFFPNTTYQQDLSVKFSSDIDEPPRLSNKVNAVVCMSSAISEKQAESLLKETLSAKASVKDDQQWTVLSDGVKLMGVRYSMGVVGSDYQFQRLVLVHALGLAYAEVFNEMMTKCKHAVQNVDHTSLLDIHEEALMFLAAHVYAHPIKRSAEVMYQTWEHVRKQLNLVALEKDCIEQWQRVGQLSRSRADAAQQRALQQEESLRALAARKQEKLANRIALAGLFLAVVTLVSVLPSDVSLFFGSWAEVVTTFVDQQGVAIKTSGRE